MAGRSELLNRFPDLDPALWDAADAQFPVRITRSWLGRMGRLGGALARQVLPGPGELLGAPGDTPDPVGESGRSPVPWVVQKHDDRVLLLLTHRCHLYCRYCFRRDQHGPDDPGEDEIDAAVAYVRRARPREVILSGGDPLTWTNDRLFALIDRLRPDVPTIRIHTRAPITAPWRVSPALVAGLSARAPVWVLVHANHPDELRGEAVAALASLVDGGVPVLNQSVLLRGVNDDVDVLAALSARLVSLRVFPYYLHHPDPVPGNGDFRVSIDDGLALYDRLSQRVSGLALPNYVIDPPDGSGKISVRRWRALRTTGPVPFRGRS